MTDTSNWDGLPDVKLDSDAAESLAAGCEAAARTLREQCSTRKTQTTNAMRDFDGRFSRIFQQNQTTADEDGEQIALALDDVAKAVRYIIGIVPDENRRRQAAREWKIRHDKDKSEITLGDLGGDEAPPEGPQSPPPPKSLSAEAAQRETPQPGSGGGGGGGGGTSSARPQELKKFVTGVNGHIQALSGKPGRLEGLNTDFTAGFDWGTGEPAGVDGSSVYSAFTLYNELNLADKTWVNTVADAFERAGSEAPGGKMVLSNAAIAASLRAAGVNASRQDIPAPSPRLYGYKPTTGYADDPVNAATGNFVEPESDLGFSGGCASLELTRMYNSFNDHVGAFGRGWSSWTETRLTFDDEAALFTQPDGRVVVFPRLGDAWDRASGESMWLDRDQAADELRVTDNDGLTWRFDRAGTPLSRDRGEGTMVSFVHEEGRLVRLQHERGRHIALTWDDDRVVAAETSDGRRVDYAYDEDRLVTATGPLGVRTYRWNDAHLIEAVIDADGVVEVENTYDDQARVTAQLSPHGRISRYSYLPGNVTEVADRDGSRANTYIHDTRGQLIGLVDSDGNRQSTSYDQHGNPVMVTARDGSVAVREFDERGRLVREVRPSGADLQFDYDEVDRVVRVTADESAETVYSYQGTSRNPSLMVDPEGGETRLEWSQGLLSRLVDPTDVELRFGYDEHGDLVSTTNAAGDTARLDYDGGGRVVAAITPSGHRTEFIYDAAGLLVERRDPDAAVWRYEYTAAGRRTAVIDPLGARTTLEHDSHGDEVRTIDPLGRSMERRLDDLGNLASVELPDGSAWRFTHDALSRLTSTTTPEGHTWVQEHDSVSDSVVVVDPLGNRTALVNDESTGTVVTTDEFGSVTRRFDPLGRAVSSEQLDGSVAMATYDRCGRPVELLDQEGSLTRIERDRAGRVVAVTDPTGRVTRYEYDACGRRVGVIDPVGARIQIEYNADSLPVRTIHPAGEVGWTDYDECMRITATHIPGVGGSRMRYDAAGRLVEIRDSTSGLRQFSYDAAGQLVTATNGNGGITHYEHDALGRAVTITDPMGGVTRREFDALDRCVAETDPLGRTTLGGYDALGRQLWQEDPSGRRIEWTYDSADRILTVSVNGRQVSANTWERRGTSVAITDRTREDGREVRHTSTWNHRGQLVCQTRDEETMSWTYDAAGRRASMTLPDGSIVDYRHDRAGRVAAVDHPLLGRVTFEHDASGRIIGAAAGGLVQTWDLDDALVVAHTATDGEGSVRTIIERDDDGRVRTVEQDGVTTTFDYDAACQMVESRVGDQVTRWRYDRAGRIATEVGPSGSHEFTYDAASQLLGVTGPEGTTEHTYDLAGRRVHTRFADGRTRALEWSPTGWLASIVDEAGGESVRTQLHVDATGQLASIDEVAVFWDSADSYAPALVQIGATPVISAGAVTGVGDQWAAPGWRTSRSHGSDVWATSQAATPPVPGVPDGVGLSPTGELIIGGLEWLRARVYDPTSRGFLSVDPLDADAGTGWAGNPYSYAGNDPLHALDPTGLKPVSEEELAAANQPWYSKAWDFVKEHKDWIIGGVLVIGGAALMATGVGGPLGAMALSAGADVLIQKATTGEVNYKQVAVSGLAGGAGFVASKSLSVGRFAMSAKGATAIKNADMARKVSTRTKVATQAGIGAVDGYSYQVAGGADPLSAKAFGGAASGMLTSGAGELASPLAEKAGSAVRARVLDGVEDQPWLSRKITEKIEAPLADHGTRFGVKTGYRGVIGSGGEFIKQTTDGEEGIDWGKVGGKGVGSGVGGHLPTGWSRPAGGGIGAGFDAAVS